MSVREARGGVWKVWKKYTFFFWKASLTVCKHPVSDASHQQSVTKTPIIINLTPHILNTRFVLSTVNKSARCNRPRMECPGDGDAKECDKKKGEERKLKDCWPDVIRNALPLNNSEKLECDYLEISGFGNETTDEVYHYVKNCAMVDFPRKVIKRTETVGLFRVVTDRTKVEQMETAAKVIREVNGRV